MCKPFIYKGMLKSESFEVTLANNQSIVLPKKHVDIFFLKGQKRVKVLATFNSNTIEFYAALNRSKSGNYHIYFSKSKQQELGIFINDYFMIQLYEDTSKYGVELSEELEAVLLSDYEAFTIFESLSPGRKRSLIYAIFRYKSPQTRIDKALLVTENLKRGITNPRIWFKRN